MVQYSTERLSDVFLIKINIKSNLSFIFRSIEVCSRSCLIPPISISTKWSSNKKICTLFGPWQFGV